ncbi:MAG: hypothetical protein AB7C95_00750 [Synergistaceae bacterium]
MEMDIDARIMAWTKAKADLAKAKDREMNLRKSITTELFPSPVEGVNTHELGKGYKIKMTHKLNRTIDEAALASVLERLPQAEECVKMKPSLAIKKFKALKDEDRLIFEECLVTKPGSPTLELVIPKEVTDGPKGPENA